MEKKTVKPMTEFTKKRVLMLGPGRRVRGGITTVVNLYYELGIEKCVDICYIPTMKDGGKIKKLFVAAIAYLRFIFNLGKCDIIHVHMAAQASFLRKSIFIKKAAACGKKIIIHQHAADFNVFFDKCDERGKKKIKDVFSLADKVIVLSEEWAEFFGTYICDKEKIIIMHNGVNVPSASKEEYGDCNVLFLGRLGERKGTYDLIKAIPDVLKHVPNAVFYLAGDGETDKCVDYAQSLGVSEHVKFLGWIGDREKKNCFENCSVFILPSYHEGMPMSILEAMAHGLATISTNAGGIPQIITDGVDGIRIDAGNVVAICDKLVYLLTNRDVKEKMGRLGREKISNAFGSKQNFDKLIDIYNSLV